MRKILIIGDTATGKTTFAKKLSEKLGLEMYSADDIFYVVKFTEKRSEPEIEKLAKEVASFTSYIVEGSSRRIHTHLLADADKIFQFRSESLFRQYYYLLKRKDPNQDLWNLVSLMKYLFCKRFEIGKAKKISYDDFLKPHMHKVIVFRHFREADAYLKKLEKK